MPFEPTDRLPLGRTGLQVTRLGLGAASIGGLYEAVTDADARRDGRARLGARHPDVRRRAAVRLRRRGATGRHGPGRTTRATSTSSRRRSAGWSAPPTRSRPARTSTPRRSSGRDDAFYARAEPLRLVFDYSADGVRRSIEESLERLGLERVDIALIHDPDDHWEQAIGEAWPALARLREEGTIRAVGAGMNQSSMLARFAREGDFDVFLRRRPLHPPRPGRPDRAAAAVRRAWDRASSRPG